jgi:23S rRNA (uracil1939-C5)-methyltransferase
MERVLDKKFKISADAFFQVNTQQAENMAFKLREYIGSAEQVLDLYCGVGFLSIMASDLAKKIYGIEISRQTIYDAIENTKLNNISNIEYIASPVELAIRNYKNIDTIILDPPRKGCDENFLHNIARIKPKQIIYISCNPTTFARDIAILDKSGYHLDKYELMDMFPQTYHVESISKIVQS